jgi:hypothetical protein
LEGLLYNQPVVAHTFCQTVWQAPISSKSYPKSSAIVAIENLWNPMLFDWGPVRTYSAITFSSLVQSLNFGSYQNEGKTILCFSDSLTGLDILAIPFSRIARASCSPDTVHKEALAI